MVTVRAGCFLAVLPMLMRWGSLSWKKRWRCAMPASRPPSCLMEGVFNAYELATARALDMHLVVHQLQQLDLLEQASLRARH
jgi:hypothetical protein